MEEKELNAFLWDLFKRGVSTPSYLSMEEVMEKFQGFLEENSTTYNDIKETLWTLNNIAN